MEKIIMPILSVILVGSILGFIACIVFLIKVSVFGSETHENECAGAVMEADAIINGGDDSLREDFNAKRDACADAVGGF